MEPLFLIVILAGIPSIINAMRTLAVLCAAALGIGAQTPGIEIHIDASSSSDIHLQASIPEGPPVSEKTAGSAVSKDTPLTSEALLLARIKLHMMEILEKQPNYTCLETVERSQRDGYTRAYRLQDTLRIEVALVNGKEMFSWPGSKQFEDKDLRKMVPTGTFGTGDFALHARSVFGGRVASFEPRGQELLDGVSAVRYDFRVPLLQSGYRIRTNDAQAFVAYHGSFWVDPQSLDLRRLEVIVDDPPPVLKLKSVSDRMDYARIRIGDGDFLLPDSSEVALMDIHGTESRNRLRFTSCRQYSGQSVLSFGDPGPGADAAPRPAKVELELPKNQRLALNLLNELDLDSAAVGDPVEAQLHHDLKVHGQMLLPKGALFHGRISRLERGEKYIVLGMIFTDAESATAHVDLKLAFDRVMGVMESVDSPGQNWQMAPPLEHEGLMVFRNTRVRLRRGILFYWTT